MMKFRTWVVCLLAAAGLVATTHGQVRAQAGLDRTLVVLEAQSRNVYLLGPGERFRLLGRANAQGLNSLELATDGNLYSVSSTTNSLHRLDPRTGIASLVGPIGTSSDGELAIGADGTAWTTGTANVISLDLATGQVLSQSGTGPLQYVALAWRAPGELVGLGTRGSNHLAVVGGDGSVFPLAPVFALIGANGGMAIDGDVGYFATGGMISGGGHKLFRFDPFTGEQTYIGPMPAMFHQHGTLGIAFLRRGKRGKPMEGPKGPITR